MLPKAHFPIGLLINFKNMQKNRTAASPGGLGGLIKLLLVMKLVWLLLALGSLQAYSKAFSQEKITVTFKDAKIKKVLSAIEHDSHYRFIYTDEILPKKRVSLSAKGQSLNQVLDKLFAHTELTYKMLQNNLVAIGTGNESLAEIMVTGKILDSASLQPLAGVTVQIKGSDIGTTTNAEGIFSLNAPENAVLRISYIGYNTREISATAKASLTIILSPASTGLNQVVVIGYGSREKKDVTGALSTLDASNIAKSTAMSPESAMKGQMAGVSVTSGGGDPSARPTIRIRGVNTFNDADPLYVIDGVPIAEGGAGVSNDVRVGDLRTPINIFSLINPNDIASITVLKDASAAAIYGVRAANGVILITTKKGVKGKPRVTLDASMGVQNVPAVFKLLNTKQFAALYQEAYANNPTLDASTGQPVPIAASTFGPTYDPGRPEYLGNSMTYNWQKALVHKNAPVNNYNVSVSGASDKTNYYFSAGYTYMAGALKQNSQERYTITSNVTSTISKFLETGLNLRLVNENTLQNTQGDLGIFKAPPWQPIYDHTGPRGFAPVVKGTFEPNPDYDPTKIASGPKYIFGQGPDPLWGPQQVTNALAQEAFNKVNYNSQMFIGSAFVQLTPLTGLRIKGTVSGELYGIKTNNWADYQGWQFSQTPGNPYNSQDGTAAGSLSIRQNKTDNLIKALNIDYRHLFGKHDLDLMVDASTQHYTWDILTSASTQINYVDPSLRYFQAIVPYATGTYLRFQNYALIGYLARLSYKYNDKYYLDATIRRDGSSRFAPGHQWGTFPSFSAAWRISQEPFMNDIKWLNDLKIRGGYGTLGNEQTTAGFAYLSTASLTPHYALGSANGDGQGTMQIASYLPTFANTGLTWEKVYTTSIGLDAILFNNTLSVTADYYHKLTRGIIQSVYLPGNAGIESPTDQNVADVLNSGVELQAGYSRDLGAVKLSFSANLTTVHNKVLSLYKHIADRPSGLEEGYPIGFIYGYRAGGIFQDQKQITDWKAKYKDAIGADDPKPGDMYFEDLYGNPAPGQTAKNKTPDSVINDNDQTYLGSTIPKFYYGFNLQLSLKGFDLSGFFLGVGDVKKYNFYRAEGEAMSSNGINQWSTTMGHWTADHPSADMPRAVYGDPNGNTRMSDRFVESAAYLRLQNVQLGYTFPADFLRRIGYVNNLRVYVSGVNLFTATHWSGIDPENDLVPSTRQFLAGIRLSF
jgi:TonB-linked SusC/RagA family outer membrane protein